MRIIRSKKFWIRITTVVITTLAFYLVLLCFPQPFFRWSVSAANLTLYSDKPFSTELGKKVLEIIQEKLAASPLYSAQEHHTAFICNARWRQRLFFNLDFGVGGVNLYPLTTNVFLRDAVIEENRLISPSGSMVAGDRTLDYFIAHEITHTLTKRGAGWYRHWKLPEWIREGYPDYVAKGSSFNYDEARRAFLEETVEMDRWKSGLYLRYHLLVAHLLDKEHWSVQRLLNDSIEQGAVEEAVRTEARQE